MGLAKLLVFPLLSIITAMPVSAGIHSINTWKQNKLVVCFAQAEGEKRSFGGTYSVKARMWSENNKQKVKDWVNSEYSSERTGIHFTGWEDCLNEPQADIPIFYSKQGILHSIMGGNKGLAYVGESSAGLVPGYPSARGAVWLGSSGINKAVVIHEFGHSAGLHHEHAHVDSLSLQPNCKLNKSKRIEASEHTVVLPFDAEAVMSYCNVLGGKNKNNGLSDKEVLLLKSLYH